MSAVRPKINLKVFEIESDVLEGIRRKRIDPFEEMRKSLEEDKIQRFCSCDSVR